MPEALNTISPLVWPVMFVKPFGQTVKKKGNIHLFSRTSRFHCIVLSKSNLLESQAPFPSENAKTAGKVKQYIG